MLRVVVCLNGFVLVGCVSLCLCSACVDVCALFVFCVLCVLCFLALCWFACVPVCLMCWVLVV